MKRKKLKNFTLALFLFSLLLSYGQERTNATKQQIELGDVSWYRNYEEAIAAAKTTNKSILIFFQEVPGCSTSAGYGQDVFTHPLMVEAVENVFVPLVIFNNVKGKDEKILAKYNEPSWNNPVVRIVDSNGTDIVERVAGDYTATGLYTAMEKALKRSNKLVPTYLKLLGNELAGANVNNVGVSHYQMYCFWSGERHIGAIDGILSTEPGFMNGHEVVKVTYDKNKITKAKLTKHAEKGSAKAIASDNSYRIAKNDQKYSLKHTNYRFLPLTSLQQTKINSALDSGKLSSGEKYLSPKQLTWYRKLEEKSTEKAILYDKDFAMAWGIKSKK